MERRYSIIESVGPHVEDVHNYRDLEKHHPTWQEDHKRRHYGTIDGEREEYVPSPSGERMVSKDFVLKVDDDANVDVPAPVTGHVRRSPRLDRWGTVEIYDSADKDARLIARVRHMQPIHVVDGEHVDVGQPLGRQGRKAPANAKVGLHTHMDIAESHLEDFKQYLGALASGAIRPDRTVVQAGHTTAHPGLSHGHLQAPDSMLAQGAHGRAVEQLQQSLHDLGYRPPQERPTTGHFDSATRRAVEQFQREHGLHVDGVVGKDTRAVFAAIEANPFINKWHPHHALYLQALHGIHAEETRRQIPHGQYSQRLAGTVAVDAVRHGLTRIDRIDFTTDGRLVRAVQVSSICDVPGLNTMTNLIATERGIRQPLSDSHAQARALSPQQLQPEQAVSTHVLPPPVHAGLGRSH